MRWLVLAVLIVAGGTARAEWVRLGESGEHSFYIDPVTIVRMDSAVKLSFLHDHKTPMTTVRGWIYRSQKVQGEFDCQRERWREVYSTFHLGQMGSGPVVGDSRSSGWMPVASESVAAAAWKLVCSKK